MFNEDELDGIFKNALPDALVVIDWFKDDCPACKVRAAAAAAQTPAVILSRLQLALQVCG